MRVPTTAVAVAALVAPAAVSAAPPATMTFEFRQGQKCAVNHLIPFLVRCTPVTRCGFGQSKGFYPVFLEGHELCTVAIIDAGFCPHEPRLRCWQGPPMKTNYLKMAVEKLEDKAIEKTGEVATDEPKGDPRGETGDIGADKAREKFTEELEAKTEEGAAEELQGKPTDDPEDKTAGEPKSRARKATEELRVEPADGTQDEAKAATQDMTKDSSETTPSVTDNPAEPEQTSTATTAAGSVEPRHNSTTNRSEGITPSTIGAEEPRENASEEDKEKPTDEATDEAKETTEVTTEDTTEDTSNDNSETTTTAARSIKPGPTSAANNPKGLVPPTTGSSNTVPPSSTGVDGSEGKAAEYEKKAADEATDEAKDTTKDTAENSSNSTSTATDSPILPKSNSMASTAEPNSAASTAAGSVGSHPTATTTTTAEPSTMTLTNGSGSMTPTAADGSVEPETASTTTTAAGFVVTQPSSIKTQGVLKTTPNTTHGAVEPRYTRTTWRTAGSAKPMPTSMIKTGGGSVEPEPTSIAAASHEPKAGSAATSPTGAVYSTTGPSISEQEHRHQEAVSAALGFDTSGPVCVFKKVPPSAAYYPRRAVLEVDMDSYRNGTGAVDKDKVPVSPRVEPCQANEANTAVTRLGDVTVPGTVISVAKTAGGDLAIRCDSGTIDGYTYHAKERTVVSDGPVAPGVAAEAGHASWTCSDGRCEQRRRCVGGAKCGFNVVVHLPAGRGAERPEAWASAAAQPCEADGPCFRVQKCRAGKCGPWEQPPRRPAPSALPWDEVRPLVSVAGDETPGAHAAEGPAPDAATGSASGPVYGVGNVPSSFGHETVASGPVDAPSTRGSNKTVPGAATEPSRAGCGRATVGFNVAAGVVALALLG